MVWRSANSVQQAYLEGRQRDNAPVQNKLLGIATGTTLFQQFTRVIALDEQMRHDDEIHRENEFKKLL